MVINGTVHCLFEQSGTFKQQFLSFGIKAFDYDLLNLCGQTDYQIDIFKEIAKAYSNRKSIFDNITQDDLIFAFFPCTYFSSENVMLFTGSHCNYKSVSTIQRNKDILRRSRQRQLFYEKCLQLFTICEARQFRLILENPYHPRHYLVSNFPYKPAIIHNNRRLYGDYFIKPTQYFFLNCQPTRLATFQKPTQYLTVNHYAGGKCDSSLLKRSIISPQYAYNFIADNIIGQPQINTQLALFP